MSKAAKKQLEGMVDENSEIQFEEAVQRVRRQQGVSEVTAETYVRDYTVTEEDAFGDRIVKNMKASAASGSSGQTANGKHDAVAQLSQEPGTETEEEFYNLPVLQDVAHPLVPDGNRTYYTREIGDTARTDLDLVTKIMNEPDYYPLLIGEPGAGKDHIFREILAQTNRPGVFVNFGVGTTYEKLIGMYQPAPSGGFEWKDGLLTACVRHGGVFVADEINAAPPEITMELHGITQTLDDRHLTVQETGEIIEPHPQFRFCATMNPEHHAGTQEMNAAFKDRSWPIEIDYIDEDAEVTLLTERTSLRDRDARSLVRMANKIRVQQAEGNITTAVTPRTLMKIGKLSEGGSFMSVEQAARTVLEGTAAQGDKAAVMKALESHI